MNLRNRVDLKPYLVKWDLVNSRDRRRSSAISRIKRERGEVVILEFGQLVLWFRIQGLFIFFKRLGGDFARLKGVFLPIYIFLGPVLVYAFQIPALADYYGSTRFENEQPWLYLLFLWCYDYVVVSV